jgi:hypothetical protein
MSMSHLTSIRRTMTFRPRSTDRSCRMFERDAVRNARNRPEPNSPLAPIPPRATDMTVTSLPTL